MTVVATGRLVHEALKAAEEAEKDGISVEVVDPRTLLPLDEETIVGSVKKTTRCVTAHEAVTRGGFGSELAAVIQHGAFDWLDAPDRARRREVRTARICSGDGAVGRPARRRRARSYPPDGGARLEMATEVKLPRLGQGMESGTIVRWLKTEGDAVTKGEPLFELDTDKVTQEVEADSDGVLLKIVVADGEVDVGTTVGIIGAQDEDVSALVAGAQGENGDAPAAPAARRAARRGVGCSERAGHGARGSTAGSAATGGARPCRGRARQGEPARAANRPRARCRPRAGRRHRAGGPRHRGGRGEGGASAGCRARGAGRPSRSTRSSSSRRRARRSRGASRKRGRRPSSSSRSARTPPSSSRRASAWSSSCARGRRSRPSRTC